jgi:hypothetical protein
MPVAALPSAERPVTQQAQMRVTCTDWAWAAPAETAAATAARRRSLDWITARILLGFGVEATLSVGPDFFNSSLRDLHEDFPEHNFTLLRYSTANKAGTKRGLARRA